MARFSPFQDDADNFEHYQTDALHPNSSAADIADNLRELQERFANTYIHPKPISFKDGAMKDAAWISGNSCPSSRNRCLNWPKSRYPTGRVRLVWKIRRVLDVPSTSIGIEISPDSLSDTTRRGSAAERKIWNFFR